MPIKYKKIQTAFTAGEISPRLLARTDLGSYEQAVKTLENAYTLAHGGVTKRNGTVYVGEVDASADPVRLIPFTFSATASYVVVMNNDKLEFVKNGSFITTGSPAVHYSIASPYADAEIDDVTYCQFGSLMILAHQNHPPKQLVRTTDTNWAITDLDFTYKVLADYWFENAYLRFKIITAGNGPDVGDKWTFTTDGSGNLTGSPSDPQWTGTGVQGSLVGLWINADLDPGVTWEITCDFATPTRTEYTITSTGSPAVSYPPCQWASGDYPQAVSFYEQRLYFAGSPSYPQTIWGSKTGDYTQLTIGPDDDDGVQFIVAANQFDHIRQMENARALLPLGFNSEYSLVGGNVGVTPNAVKVRAHTYHGTSMVKPQRVDHEVLIVQKDGLKVRAISYDVTLDSNVAPDLTLLAEHITAPGVIDFTYQQTPDSVAYAVRSDGTLLSLTHMRSQDVTAWARHTTDGDFKAVCAIPEGTGDTTYLCVERVIDGNTVKYIEYFDSSVYVDCALEGTSSPGAATWSGLDHLEGESVQIRADSAVHANRTVSSGSVTLQDTAEDVQIGLAIPEMNVTLLHPEVLSSEGTAQGSKLRVYEAIIRVKDTIGLTVDGKVIPNWKTNELLDQTPSPFTGDMEPIKFDGYQTPYNLEITHDIPMPCTILGVIMKVNVGD